jgi:hypothetical protein
MDKGAQYAEFADTVAHRLTPNQFEALGIQWEETNEDTWSHRLWRANKRLTTLVDPYYLTQKRRRITLAEQVIATNERNRGDQRFTYPDPRTYMAYDTATGRRIPPSKNTLRGSVTIHPYPEVARHLQRHAWGTAEWRKASGQRNQVESVNKGIKHTRFTDLESEAKRPGRGEAYQSIATAVMAVAHNVRVLVSALVQECTPAGRRRRKSRKKFSAEDMRNVRPATVGAPAPPV